MTMRSTGFDSKRAFTLEDGVGSYFLALLIVVWSATAGAGGVFFQASSYFLPLFALLFNRTRRAIRQISVETGWWVLLALFVPLLIADLFGVANGHSASLHDIFVFFWRLVVFPVALAAAADGYGYDKRQFGRILIAIVSLYALFGLLGYTTGYHLYKGGGSPNRMDDIVGNPNPFGLLMAFGTAVLLGQRRLWGRWPNLVATYVPLLILVLCTVLSGSRGAWLALLIGGLTVLMTRLRDIPRAAYLVGTGIVMVVWVTVITQPGISRYLKSRFFHFDHDPARVHIWRHYWHMARENLLIGHGTQPMYFDFSGQRIAGSHDIYLEVLFRTGLPGLILFIVFLSWLGWRLWRVPSKRPLLGLLAVLLVAGAFDYSIYGAAIYQSLFGLVLALALCSPARALSNTQAPDGGGRR